MSNINSTSLRSHTLSLLYISRRSHYFQRLYLLKVNYNSPGLRYDDIASTYYSISGYSSSEHCYLLYADALGSLQTPYAQGADIIYALVHKLIICR
jgi:hypothetical protein